MNDLLNLVYAEGDILKTFVQLILVVVGLDLVTLVLMLFGRATKDVI